MEGSPAVPREIDGRSAGRPFIIDWQACAMTEKYDGFMSYSHAVDGRLAPALQLGLHRLARPWNRLRALRIFRDKTSLAANPALWTNIQTGLSGSRYFLLLASPQAAQSPWVHKEIEWWLANRSADSVLLVWTEGQLTWNPEINDFDWATTTCLPVQLKGKFAQEPLYVDLTWAREDHDLSLRKSRFRGAVLDLATPMHGCAKDALDGEDVRQFRKARAARQIGVVLIALLAVVAAGMAYRSSQNANRAEQNANRATQNASRAEAATQREAKERQRAEEQRDEAERQKNIAMARQLAARSQVLTTQRGTLLNTAALLAVEAMHRDPSLEADQALRQVLALLPKRIAEIPCATGGDVQTGAFSPNGEQLATVAQDQVFRLWATRTGQMLRQERVGGTIKKIQLTDQHALVLTDSGRLQAGPALKGPWREIAATAVTDASFSADGEVMAVVDRAATRLFNVPDYDPIATMRGSTPMSHVEVRSGGTEVIAWGDESAEIFRAPGPPVQTMPLGSGGVQFRYSPDGRYLAIVNPRAFEVTLLDVETRRRLIFEKNKVHAAFSENAHMFSVASPEWYATTWDLPSCHESGSYFEAGGRGTVALRSLQGDASCRRVTDVRHDNSVWRSSLSQDGNLLATVSEDGTLRVWDAHRGREVLRIMDAGGRGVRDVSFTADGTFLAMWSPRACTVWEAQAHRQALEFLHQDGVFSLAFSADGRRLATSSRSGFLETQVQMWEGAKLPRVGPGPLGGRVHVMSFSRDQNRILLSNGVIWNASARPEARPSIAGLEAVSRDWRVGVAIRKERTLVVSALANGRELKSRTFGAATAVPALDPLGRHLVVLERGKRLQLWEWEKNALEETLLEGTGVRTVAFDSSGSRMAVAYDRDQPRVEIWSVDPLERVAVLPHEVSVNSAAFDASGRFVVTASSDRSARVWDVEARRVTAELKHDDEVWSAEFSPDGSYVASGGGRSDRTVRLWLWRPGDLIAEVCRRTRRDLTPDEWQQYLQPEPYRRSCEGVLK